MKKVNLFKNYSSKKIARKTSNFRKIKNKIIATSRDKEFFDGNRVNGYGGYSYDGRWVKYAETIINKYHLKNYSKFLHLNCEKGFLMHDIQNLNNKIEVHGTESSHYAIKNSMKNIKKNIKFNNHLELPYKTNYFDFVLGLGVIYALSLTDAIICLKEISRVSKRDSFVNLATYKTKKDLELFKNWSLLGVTFLKENEWIEVLKSSNYNGDYYFTSSQSLGLV